MSVFSLSRRDVIGAGLAFASITGVFGANAHAQTARHAHDVHIIDALLVDGGMTMTPPIEAFIQARRRTIAVVDIILDAAAHSKLKRVFEESRVVIGISSGATLFCLERIAWDHGFRLAARDQRSFCDLKADACSQDMAIFLNSAYPAAMPSPPSAYRPSHLDGMVHAWAMTKTARSYAAQDRREA